MRYSKLFLLGSPGVGHDTSLEYLGDSRNVCESLCKATARAAFRTGDSDVFLYEHLTYHVQEVFIVVTVYEFTYEIVEQVGILSQNTNGWSRQINRISWNGREPKYDIRDWAPNNEKMGKGISLSGEELQILKEILNSMDI